MNSTTLFVIVLCMWISGAIIIAIGLSKTFAKSPNIDLVQGRLSNENGDDIKEAMKYLKIVNNE